MRLLPLLLLLTACGVPQGDSPEAKCARQAQNDPAVVEMYTGTNGIYMWSQYDQAELKALKREAETKCLQRMGLAPPGGVQAVRKYP